MLGYVTEHIAYANFVFRGWENKDFSLKLKLVHAYSFIK
jgi:hypothetical protein